MKDKSGKKRGSEEAKSCVGIVSFSTRLSSETLSLIDLTPSQFLLFLPNDS